MLSNDPGLIRLHNEIKMFCEEKGLTATMKESIQPDIINAEISGITPDLLRELQERLTAL